MQGFLLSTQFATPQPNFNFFNPQPQVRKNLVSEVRIASPQRVEKVGKKVEKVETANTPKKDNS